MANTSKVVVVQISYRSSFAATATGFVVLFWWWNCWRHGGWQPETTRHESSFSVCIRKLFTYGCLVFKRATVLRSIYSSVVGNVVYNCAVSSLFLCVCDFFVWFLEVLSSVMFVFVCLLSSGIRVALQHVVNHKLVTIIFSVVLSDMMTKISGIKLEDIDFKVLRRL